MPLKMTRELNYVYLLTKFQEGSLRIALASIRKVNVWLIEKSPLKVCTAIVHWGLTFEGHQVGEEQTPDNPQRWAVAEVFGPLSAPWIEAKGTEPLVDCHAEGSDVKGDENGDPQFRAEGHQEGQQRDLHLPAERKK